MVQARIDATQAVAERMHAAQAFLERHRALHRRAHQVHTGLAVGTVAGGALDVRPAAGQAVQRDAVRRRVKGGRHESLHAMCHRVHAGRGRQAWWQPEREFRVADCHPGNQVPGVEPELAMVVQYQDGTACNFAAGAAGGWHGDQWHAAIGDQRRAAFDGGVGFERPRVARRDGHALGAVDCRAATHRDQAITALRVEQRNCGAHRSFGRVGRGLVEHRWLLSGQGVQRFLQDAGGTHALIGDHQRAGDAGSFALLREQPDGTKVELDLCHIMDKGHRSIGRLRKADCIRQRGVPDPNHARNGNYVFP